LNLTCRGSSRGPGSPMGEPIPTFGRKNRHDSSPSVSLCPSSSAYIIIKSMSVIPAASLRLYRKIVAILSRGLKLRTPAEGSCSFPNDYMSTTCRLVLRDSGRATVCPLGRHRNCMLYRGAKFPLSAATGPRCCTNGCHAC